MSNTYDLTTFAWSHDPGPRRRPSAAAVSALAVALAVHAGIVGYVSQAGFRSHVREFTEQVAEVQLVRARPPAPPAPPPPPPKAQRPPPKAKAPQPQAARAVAAVRPRPAVSAPAQAAHALPLPPAAEASGVPGPAPAAPAALPEAAPAPARPEPRPPSAITNPDWSRRPSGEEIARYYPVRAARLGVEGRAVIACGVSAEGRLHACAIAQETPGGHGFGDAALKMSRHFELRPMTRDGAPVSGGVIRIPIRFTLDG